MLGYKIPGDNPLLMSSPDYPAHSRTLYCFVVLSQRGGVLERGGHTEAAVDLAKLAGLSPVGVLCEITTKDGKHMAR